MKVAGGTVCALLFSLLCLLCSCLASGFGTLEVVSQMSGKILNIFVEENSIVSSADNLLQMEAMKMQHYIRAPFAGEQVVRFKVRKIHVGKDAVVDTGAPLITLQMN